jgi:hypothetical protein
MMKLLYTLISFFLFGVSFSAFTQTSELTGKLKWHGIVTETFPNGQHNHYLYFEGATMDIKSGLPSVTHEIAQEEAFFEATFKHAEFAACTSEESAFLSQNEMIGTEIAVHFNYYEHRKEISTLLSFLPFRKNPVSGSFEKLISYQLVLTKSEGFEKTKPGVAKEYAENSVLSEGEWYKFRVSETGIHKLTYQDLANAGLDLASLDPRELQLYGNAGYMLPEANSLSRPDDLQENAIYIYGEEDGSFDPEDYILFYGLSPHKIHEVLGFFTYQPHLYDDYNYYFLTIGKEAGKRIETIPAATGPPTHIVNKFNDCAFYEEENINLIESGKTWYADEFGEVLSRNYQFNFPDIITNEPVIIKFGAANRTFVNDLMVMSVNNALHDTTVLTSISINSTKFAQYRKKTLTYVSGGPEINITVDYIPNSPSSNLWLDYVYINVMSELTLTSGQRSFRYLPSVEDDAISSFFISNTTASALVWDVSDYIAPKNMEVAFESDHTVIKCPTHELREFIVFDGSAFYHPGFVGQIQNQNLHGLEPVDYVMIAHPLFMEQAQRLKQIHETRNQFEVLLTTPEEIYNEFSSGKQDPTAIRDLMKMFYDRSDGTKPRFLLLFGQGSFDPKDRIEHNTNFVVTFQTEESLMTASSFVVDDYFGMLDESEGNDAIGYLDIGIGRFPVKTPEEGKIIVDKIHSYLEPGEPQFGSWRTKICLIADDEDSNLHLIQADSLASTFGYLPHGYNLNKIYLDAFPQTSTPSGDRYPEVNRKIKEQVDEGALLVNYIGHGGTGGWAHERILQQNDMQDWKNSPKLPVFITATCEFSRFDDPEITSGGELVILNPEGGGIALFTTTRLAYAQANFRLNERVYSHAFIETNGEMPFLGDIIRESKPPGQWSTRNFVLLGDPGVRMAYPKYKVNTKTINGQEVNSMKRDTLRGLQKVEISGEITDSNGNAVNDFNGFIYPVLYDKTTVYKTFGNDPASFPVEFTNQDKVIWHGVSTVENGMFSFSFVIPKDIGAQFGQGKISYYTHSDNSDGFGFYNQFFIGGLDENALPDNTGPEIKLFINDLDFVSGDQTHENPILLAFLHDESGINLSDGSIGRNITCVLNNDYSNIIVLDDYFEPDMDSFESGSLAFPFYNLPDGLHTLKLKAWDAYGNVNERSIDFVIDRSGKLQLTQLINYPNPFNEMTTFAFRHTKPGENLSIDLEIFDLTGQLVVSHTTQIQSTNTYTPFLEWNVTNGQGLDVESGIYIYQVTVTDEAGNEARQHQKLIIQ